MSCHPDRYPRLRGLLLVGILAFPARAESDPQPLPAAQAALEQWLIATGLSDQLSMVRLRRTSRRENPDQRWLGLELRYVARAPQDKTLAADLAERWQEFARKHNRGLPETLFYRLLDVTGFDRADAFVNVFVGDTSFAIFYDRSQRGLVVKNGLDRGVRLPVALEGLLGSTPGVNLPTQAGAARIQAFLQGFFRDANRAAGIPAPVFDLAPLESDYAGLSVEGLKGCVESDRRLWERLQVHVELRTTKDGHRAICYLTGKHAGGIGSQRPGAYPEEISDAALERFARRLMATLQAALSAGK